ncbi:MAG: carboxylesterase family protein [Planctomycetes bacterium]|nr:carboxylesterase family protein [Planctomycetota bacterium]
MPSLRSGSRVLAIVPALALLALSSAASAQDAPRVRTTAGLVLGETLARGTVPIHAFRGIPFAAPPVGALRWRAPQPPEPWEGERACTRFSPACPQPQDLTSGLAFRTQSEDCLYLNVWTPSLEPARGLPVMVWIHGGGNLVGGAGSPVYDGRHLAAAGVVLVSIQYRLGVFGYFAHPALSAENAELEQRASSGNQGLLDQLAALRWVQANIAAFGGDPDCVTIFGESAGAANVTHLMASPLAAGLFHRAIAQSGYYGENTPPLDGRVARGTSGHALGKDVAKRLGVEGEDRDALAKLRALSVDELLAIPVAIGSLGNAERGERALHPGPIVDGHVLPEAPELVWSSGRMAKVPFLAGSLLDDGSVFSRSLPVRRVLGYRLALRTLFGADADEVFALFPAADDAAVKDAAHELITAYAFTAPARRLCRFVEAAGGTSWLYQFTRRPQRGRAAREGVFHGLEIGYVFGTLAAFGDERDAALSAELIRRWTDFARHGDPNGPAVDNGSPSPWPPHTRAADEHYEFGDESRVGTGLARAACDRFDAIAARR